MKCLIVDDSPLAIEIIETYLCKIDDIEIIAKCTNPIEALNILTNQTVDLVFLDIQMPNLTGLELVKTLDKLPLFIFTTAYPQYALDGFELNATDYLVKPIPFDRFLKAISRAKELYKLKQKKHIQASPPTRNYIFVKSEYDNVKIAVNTIKYIEGLGGYIRIYTTDSAKPVMTLMNFSEILEKLGNSNFIRVHRSFIVNIEHIDTLQKTKIIIDDKLIPIGETYKKQVLMQLGL